jgi:alkaline phosphatase
MKRFATGICLLLCIVATSFAQDAKYVFYFIGDGMGVNQINGTEQYLAELEGRIGIKPLLFTQFPHYTVATTYSATNGVTDSSASGTALATGKKTKNGVVGVLKDSETPVNSVAVWAKKKGVRVGVSTSVCIDHATPAAFYAHQPQRRMYYEIANDLLVSDFDYFGGSDFLYPTGKKGDQPDLYELFKKAGYTIYRGMPAFEKGKKRDRVILFQPEGKIKNCLPYAIDRQPDDLTLPEIVKAGIECLNNKKGFFFMVEGGKIDWACHDNDAATAFQEVVDFDNAIRVAYEFYEQHPKETLIVITADHETGGFVLGNFNKYDLNLKALASQKKSLTELSNRVNKLRKENPGAVTWEMIQQVFREDLGFWGEIQLTEAQEKRLKAVYEETFLSDDVKMKENEYSENEPVAAAAKEILNDIALVGWRTGGHSSGYTPVIAIGAGSELFEGRTDNAEIPLKIAKAAGYTAE